MMGGETWPSQEAWEDDGGQGADGGGLGGGAEGRGEGLSAGRARGKAQSVEHGPGAVAGLGRRGWGSHWWDRDSAPAVSAPQDPSLGGGGGGVGGGAAGGAGRDRGMKRRKAIFTVFYLVGAGLEGSYPLQAVVVSVVVAVVAAFVAAGSEGDCKSDSGTQLEE